MIRQICLISFSFSFPWPRSSLSMQLSHAVRQCAAVRTSSYHHSISPRSPLLHFYVLPCWVYVCTIITLACGYVQYDIHPHYRRGAFNPPYIHMRLLRGSSIPGGEGGVEREGVRETSTAYIDARDIRLYVTGTWLYHIHDTYPRPC